MFEFFSAKNAAGVFDVVVREFGNHFPVRSFVHRPYAPAKI
jgi:hypothetical protein